MNIRKRGKSYQITVYLGSDGSGKYVTKRATFTPEEGLTASQERKAVDEFADKFERRCKGGAPVKYDKLKFRDFCSGLYAENHLKNLKIKTRTGYEEIIEKRLNPTFGDMEIRKINSINVQSWLSSLDRLSTSNRTGALSPNSAGVWFRTLSAIMGKAYEWNIIDENPCKRVHAPRKKAVNVQAWELEDYRKVMSKLYDYPDIRISMFVDLVLNSGIREAEAAGLEWRDFDFENNYFVVVRTSQYINGQGMVEGTPKSDSSRRMVNFGEKLKENLLRYKQWQDARMDEIGDLYIGNPGEQRRLFTSWNGAPINDKTLRKWLRKYEDWCEVPRITVHGMRHTFASILIAHNTDARTVADLLGHSTPSLVMNTYANPQSEAKQRAVNLLEGLANQPKPGPVEVLRKDEGSKELDIYSVI